MDSSVKARTSPSECFACFRNSSGQETPGARRRPEFLFSPAVTETRITAHESPCAKHFRNMGRTSSSQQRLLTAASDLLWEKSYHSVTVDEVCARAGVMKGSLYHFYDSALMSLCAPEFGRADELSLPRRAE